MGVSSRLKNLHYHMLISLSDVEYSDRLRQKLLHLCRGNGIILYHCTPSNGILYPFEGAVTSDAGKWKNCNTFLSFSLGILSQIRSRGVASGLCNNEMHWSVGNSRWTSLEDQKGLFPCRLSRHINISDETICQALANIAERETGSHSFVFWHWLGTVFYICPLICNYQICKTTVN